MRGRERNQVVLPWEEPGGVTIVGHKIGICQPEI